MYVLSNILFSKSVFIPLLLVFSFIDASYGQFSINEYLADARNDVRMLENKVKSEFLDRNPYRSPFLHRVEFRARTNNLDISADDFRLRFNPTNPYEIRANKKYYQLESNSLIIHYQYALNKEIYSRYNKIISCLLITDEIAFKEKEILIQEDQLKILQADLTDNNFEIGEYIEHKEELVNLILEFNELKHDREKIIHEIRSETSFKGDIVLKYDSFVSYEQVKEIVDLTSAVSDTTNNIHIESLNQQAVLDEQRIQVEKAEGRRNVGFIQGEYDRLRGDEIYDYFGVQVGVRIPLTNADKPDLNRRKFDLIEDKADIVKEKTALDVQCDLLKLDIQYLLSQNDLITGAIADDDLLKLLNQDRNLKAKELLQAQKSILKMKKYEKKIQWDIYQSFIDYLYYSGKLVDVPIKNYLSKNLEEI